MATPKVVNLDDIITSVDAVTDTSSKGNEYSYISIRLDSGKEIRYLPEDRSLVQLLAAEKELVALRAAQK